MKKQDERMDERMKALIAIGAAGGANCIPCLRFHLKKAREAGAGDDEIGEAVRVARMVRAGAARKWDEEAKALIEPMPAVASPS